MNVKHQKKTQHLCLRLDEETQAGLDRLAQAEDRSRSYVVRQLIRQRLSEYRTASAGYGPGVGQEVPGRG